MGVGGGGGRRATMVDRWCRVPDELNRPPRADPRDDPLPAGGRRGVAARRRHPSGAPGLGEGRPVAPRLPDRLARPTRLQRRQLDADVRHRHLHGPPDAPGRLGRLRDVRPDGADARVHGARWRRRRPVRPTPSAHHVAVRPAGDRHRARAADHHRQDTVEGGGDRADLRRGRRQLAQRTRLQRHAPCPRRPRRPRGCDLAQLGGDQRLARDRPGARRAALSRPRRRLDLPAQRGDVRVRHRRAPAHPAAHLPSIGHGRRRAAARRRPRRPRRSGAHPAAALARDVLAVLTPVRIALVDDHARAPRAALDDVDRCALRGVRRGSPRRQPGRRQSLPGELGEGAAGPRGVRRVRPHHGGDHGGRAAGRRVSGVLRARRVLLRHDHGDAHHPADPRARQHPRAGDVVVVHGVRGDGGPLRSDLRAAARRQRSAARARHQCGGRRAPGLVVQPRPAAGHDKPAGT